ncbi:MAG: hypothetical protein AAGF11_50885 [Myxococcota bacterium]
MGDWLVNLEHLEEALAGISTILPGHGGPADASLLREQHAYIELYRQTVEALAQGQPMLTEAAKGELTAVMKEHLPAEALEFLIPLGADPVAMELRGQ